ncbi:hypothetical protein QOZ80_2AG0145940 [Eleusine coracana subsp. coracana]|nr:hypothetical protein QOZ80_2AG0145940 [Eleusine coracana subsp. coracana]
MLVSSPHHHSSAAQKFSPAIASGLRSLLVVPPSGGGGIIVTRAIAASSSRGCRPPGGGVVQESRDGASNIDEDNDAKVEEEEDAEVEEEEDVMRADEEEDEGCWVSYGRREPRHRLPPPIPSLLARGALRRTRTVDGRLVIRIAPVVWRDCIRARRRGGRLTMQLVEHDDPSPLTRPAPIGQDETSSTEKPDDDDTSSPAIRERVDDDGHRIGSEGVEGERRAAAQETTTVLPVVPPPRVPSGGCFEDVFKYSAIGGGSSLHPMPSLRMVH